MDRQTKHLGPGVWGIDDISLHEKKNQQHEGTVILKKKREEWRSLGESQVYNR